ncbi:MAG: polysaccharide biosynthesis C-terminal domain-containing protein [Bacteroidota bacterium]
MSSIKKLASQTAVYGLSTIVGRMFNFLLVPLHTALFSKADFGTQSEMYGYVAFFNVLLLYGMETAFFRFTNDNKENPKIYSTALISVIISSVSFMLIFILFSQPIASLIRYPNNAEYIVYFALIIGLDAITMLPFAYLRQQNKPLKFAIIKNINIFTSILLNLYFLLLGPYMQNKGIMIPLFDGEIGIKYVFISHLIASIITVPMLIFEIKKIQLGFDFAVWKQMLVYGAPLIIVGFAGMINETLDRVLIKYLYPNASLANEMNGIYAANYKLSILMTLFIQAFKFAAEPFFFNHAKTTDKRTIYATVMDYFVIICLSLFLMVTLFIDVFKQYIDVKFHAGLHVVPILLLANMFLGIYYNLSIWYKLSDNNKKGANISIMGAVITLVLNFIWIPIYGYTGSAWATFICYFSMMVVSYFMGKKYYPIHYHVNKFIGYTLFALLLFYISKMVNDLIPEQLYLYAMNTILLLSFFAVAFVIEKRFKTIHNL